MMLNYILNYIFINKSKLSALSGDASAEWQRQNESTQVYCQW